MNYKVKTFKANELNLPIDGFYLSTKEFPPRSHIRDILILGRAFPTTKAQAAAFIRYGSYFDFLNMDDVLHIEEFINQYGFEGMYRYTKSKQNVRASITTQSDFIASLKVHFGLVKNTEKFLKGYKKAWHATGKGLLDENVQPNNQNVRNTIINSFK